jgi:hypothetical protein
MPNFSQIASNSSPWGSKESVIGNGDRFIRKSEGEEEKLTKSSNALRVWNVTSFRNFAKHGRIGTITYPFLKLDCGGTQNKGND